MRDKGPAREVKLVMDVGLLAEQSQAEGRRLLSSPRPLNNGWPQAFYNSGCKA